ncbi:MAG: DegV family protein [Clostridiales bacterium]|jgi:DegV family protein with EDD domain|nr:DegV family protein [Clostridiales bacterium]
MIKIFTDSDGDMPRELFEKYGVGVVPFGISYGDERFVTDFYDLTPKEFYAKCRATDAYPKTSQPTYANYEERLRPALQEGHDVFCLTITSKFSGSYQSGVMAERNLREEFPGRKIVIMDSKRCTVIHGYLLYQACRMVDDGMGFDSLVNTVDSLRDKFFIYVTVDSLEYLRKGGRLGRAGALAGSILNIKPIISFFDGELQPHSKMRGKKNAVNEIVKLLAKDAAGNMDQYAATAFCADEIETRADIADKLREAGFGPEITQWEIGPVVGAHLGPTGFAAMINKKYCERY